MSTKIILAVILSTIIVPYFSETLFKWSKEVYTKQQKVVQKTIQRKHSANNKSPWVLALEDICQPFFLLSFLLGAVFVVFSFGDQAKVVWLALRPIAFAYLFFVLSRSSLFSNGVQKLRKVSFFNHFFATFDQAVQFLTYDHSLSVDETKNKELKTKAKT